MYIYVLTHVRIYIYVSVNRKGQICHHHFQLHFFLAHVRMDAQIGPNPGKYKVPLTSDGTERACLLPDGTLPFHDLAEHKQCLLSSIYSSLPFIH